MRALCNALEAAIKLHIEKQEIPLRVFTGQGDYSKVTPSLVIHAQGGPELPQNSGNFVVTVNCEIRYPAASENLNAHAALAVAAERELRRPDLPSFLFDDDGLTVYDPIIRTEVDSRIDENQWLTTIRFDCYCCFLDT